MNISDISQFNPPYDSPIQDGLAWVLSKYLARDTILHKEKEIPTSISNFRVDLVLERLGNKAIGIECDGKDFHDPVADLFRDALILGNSNLATIYRFPGRVLSNYPEDALYLLSYWEPDFFNERIVNQRSLLASKEVQEALEYKSWQKHYPYIFDWNYKDENDRPLLVYVIRHCFGLPNPPPEAVDFIWAFSKATEYNSLESLAEAYAKKHPTRDWRGWGYYVLQRSAMFDSLDAKFHKKETS